MQASITIEHDTCYALHIWHYTRNGLRNRLISPALIESNVNEVDALVMETRYAPTSQCLLVCSE